MRVAAIDMGSNSFLCLIAEKNERGELIEVYDTIEFVKLGEGVHQNRKFSQAALERADSALKKFRNKINELKVDKVAAVATSAARDVSNKNDFFNLCDKYQIPTSVITGENEGLYTYNGVLSGDPNLKDFAVIDIGGGSTEFAFKESGKILSQSFDIGCVRLTEMFLKSNPETENEINDFKNYLDQNLKEVSFLNDKKYESLVAVAGTPTTLASLYLSKPFDPNLIDQFVLTKKMIHELYLKLKPLTISQRKLLPGIDAPRADVIMAGLLIIDHSLTILKLDQVTVSTRGVRYGLAFEMLGS